MPTGSGRRTTIGDFLLRRLSGAGLNDTMVFVESVMDRYDLPAAAIATGSNGGADLEYGPRGPQHRDNAQIRP